MAVAQLTMPFAKDQNFVMTIFNIQNFHGLLKTFEIALRDGIVQLMVAQGVPTDSNILDSIDISYQQDMFQLLANDYYQYVSKGRRPHARKVPIKDLIQWIKDKGIPYRGSINSAAFAIQQSIYKNGIKGKNYEEAVIDFSTTLISEVVSENISNWAMVGIVQEMQKFVDGKWITINVSFNPAKWLINKGLSDIQHTSGVRFKWIAK